jgi:hypothetical protein
VEASSPVGRRRWRWVLLVVLLLLAGWAAWTASALLSARTDLRAAQQELESARAQADGPSLVELVDVVETARSRASAADEALSAPGPRWAARVPIIGRSVEGPAAVAGAVDAVLATAGEALPQLVAVEAQGGRVDLDALERLETALLAGASRSAAPLRRLEAVELSLTPGAVRRPCSRPSGCWKAVPGTWRTPAGRRAPWPGCWGPTVPATWCSRS